MTNDGKTKTLILLCGRPGGLRHWALAFRSASELNSLFQYPIRRCVDIQTHSIRIYSPLCTSI